MKSHAGVLREGFLALQKFLRKQSLVEIRAVLCHPSSSQSCDAYRATSTRRSDAPRPPVLCVRAAGIDVRKAAGLSSCAGSSGVALPGAAANRPARHGGTALEPSRSRSGSRNAGVRTNATCKCPGTGKGKCHKCLMATGTSTTKQCLGAGSKPRDQLGSVTQEKKTCTPIGGTKKMRTEVE